jgi:4-amino-4-deoxy-L-arabinose transferase-like glycosyltransferase
MEKDEERQSCRKAVLALILLSVLAWLPGFFTLPPLDRDESRFAQASKQMLETGDFVDIKLGETNRYEKPVGIYWLQAASTSVLGLGTRDAIWTYRVPSFLGALAAVLATFHIARLLAGIEAGFAAGAVLALSVLLMAEAKIAKTDAVLAGTVAVAQWAIMRAYLDARGRIAVSSMKTALFGWAAFGLGVLVKGPLIALVCGLSVVAVSLWDRDASWLKRLYPLRGFLVVLAIVLPWLIAIGIASDGAFFRQSLGQDFGGKVMGDAEAHGAPPGYFAVLMFATFWPGSLALLPALLLAFHRSKEPAIRYLLCWAVTTWLMFEIVPTKLPHYVLPAYPALAVLCGVWLTEQGARASLWSRVAAFVSLAAFVGVGLALAAFFVLAPERLGDGSPWWLYAQALLAAVLIGAAFLIADRRMKGAVAALAALILYELGGYETIPRLQSLWLSPRLAAAVERHAQAGDPPVITAGYAEPSVTFLLGTGTRLLLGDEAGKAAAQGGGLAAVEQGEQSAFLESLASAGAHAGAVEEIDGLNYSRGREARITLYRVTRDAR